MTASVPPDGPVQLGAIQLPAGRQISGRESDPLLWAAATAVPDAGPLWQAVSDLHPETGLVPILLGFMQPGQTEGRPWDSGELGNACELADVDELDPATVLATSWASSLDPDGDDPEQLELIAPFSLEFPGLAPGGGAALTAAELSRAVSSLPPARIGLVPASRPADALTVVGFEGAVSRYGGPAQLCAVLRSWEERFDAVLLEVGFAHIRLLVRRPPRTQSAAQAAAAEIWAMCDEFWPIEQPGTGVWDVGDTAEYITGAPFWTLWLD
jgi:hypothetical protein